MFCIFYRNVLFEPGPNGTYYVICPICYIHCIRCLMHFKGIYSFIWKCASLLKLCTILLNKLILIFSQNKLGLKGLNFDKQEDKLIEWKTKGQAKMLNINILWYTSCFRRELPFFGEKTGPMPSASGSYSRLVSRRNAGGDRNF